MTISTDELNAQATDVRVTEEELIVGLVDGRTITAPVAWFPRLRHGTARERSKWRLIGRGEGINWPELDEDVSVRNLLLGQPSRESQASFKRWLESRSVKKEAKNRKK